MLRLTTPCVCRAEFAEHERLFSPLTRKLSLSPLSLPHLLELSLASAALGMLLCHHNLLISLPDRKNETSL